MHAPPPSIVLHSSLRCLHMITFNQVLSCQQQLRHYAGQNIKWRVFVVAVVVIRDIVATSCRDRRGGGGGQHRETEAPLAEQREVLVGQSVVMVGGC